MATKYDYWVAKHELVQAMQWSGKQTQWRELLEFCGKGRIDAKMKDDCSIDVHLLNERHILKPGDWVVKKYLVEGELIPYKPAAFKMAFWKADKTLNKKNEVRSTLRMKPLTASENNE